MKVKELIVALGEMPQDAEVAHLWDGALRSTISFVWLAKCGLVATAPEDMVCYYDEDRPAKAPKEDADSYWGTPAKRTGKTREFCEAYGVIGHAQDETSKPTRR